MAVSPDLSGKMATEIERLEEDCIHSGKSQFNAGDRWRGLNLLLGVPSVIMGATAGTAFMKSAPDIAGVLALMAAALTGLITFLKPSERAASHKSAGDQYLALRNDARVFRQIRLAHVCDDAVALAGLDELSKRRRELNMASPQVATGDFNKARNGIDKGEAEHAVDKGV